MVPILYILYEKINKEVREFRYPINIVIHIYYL